MSPTFDELSQRIEETGRLWVLVFGRWTPVAEPEDGGAGVPARPNDRPPRVDGRAQPSSRPAPTDRRELPAMGQQAVCDRQSNCLLPCGILARQEILIGAIEVLCQLNVPI
jgi:hypothetical protein